MRLNREAGGGFRRVPADLHRILKEARELSGASGMLFRRNSQTGAVEAVQRTGDWGGLNAALHVNR